MSVFFTSTFGLKIDPKNRLFVPAEIRKRIDREQLGSGFYLNMGPNQRVWMYPEKTYEAWLSQIKLEMSPDDDSIDLVHWKFSMVREVQPDDQGRLLLPEDLLSRAGIEKDVTLVGAGDHLEIWNRTAWEARWQELWTNGRDIEKRCKAAGKI
jgi:MraZ protein